MFVDNEWQQALPTFTLILISQLIQFLSVAVITVCLNTTTFFEESNMNFLHYDLPCILKTNELVLRFPCI